MVFDAPESGPRLLQARCEHYSVLNIPRQNPSHSLTSTAYQWTVLGVRDLLVALLVIAASAILNRIAGGGRPYVTELPGRAMLYAAAGMFALTALYLSFWFRRWIGLAIPLWVAASYALWRTFEWGTVFDLGRLPDEPPRSPFGALFFITGSDYADLWLRMAVGLVPGTILGAWLMHCRIIHIRLRSLLVTWIGFATAIWLAYVVAWEIREVHIILFAELIAGSIWGLAVSSTPALWRDAA